MPLPARQRKALSHTTFCHPCPQLLHWTWSNNQRLWLLATPVSSGAALSLGQLIEAWQACRQHQHQQGGSGSTWAARHWEAASLGLAAAGSLAMAASVGCLLAGAAVAAAGDASGSAAAAGGGEDEEAREALLGEEGRRRKDKKGKKQRVGGSSQRMRLIQGTLKYLVPDSLHLKVRLAACFLLLAVGRVVNIGLPLAYKHVIDRLADTGAAAAAAAAAAGASGSGGGGGPAVRALCASLLEQAVPTFRDVFFPWVALYLLFTFLQVGGWWPSAQWLLVC
jgi:hypothetical protein